MLKPVFPRKRMPSIAQYCSAPGLKKPKMNEAYLIERKALQKEYKKAVAEYWVKLKEWNAWKRNAAQECIENIAAAKKPCSAIPAGLKEEDQGLTTEDD